MVITNKFPMKISVTDKKGNYYNSSLTDAYYDYQEQVGCLFVYDVKRKNNYKYKANDVIGAISSKCYITNDKEVLFLTEITNSNFDYLSSLKYNFYYVWPRMVMMEHANGNIQVKEIIALELII